MNNLCCQWRSTFGLQIINASMLLSYPLLLPQMTSNVLWKMTQCFFSQKRCILISLKVSFVRIQFPLFSVTMVGYNSLITPCRRRVYTLWTTSTVRFDADRTMLLIDEVHMLVVLKPITGPPDQWWMFGGRFLAFSNYPTETINFEKQV